MIRWAFGWTAAFLPAAHAMRRCVAAVARAISEPTAQSRKYMRRCKVRPVHKKRGKLVQILKDQITAATTCDHPNSNRTQLCREMCPRAWQ